MTFLWPGMLWLLAVVPVLVALYFAVVGLVGVYLGFIRILDLIHLGLIIFQCQQIGGHLHIIRVLWRLRRHGWYDRLGRWFSNIGGSSWLGLVYDGIIRFSCSGEAARICSQRVNTHAAAAIGLFIFQGHRIPQGFRQRPAGITGHIGTHA